MAVHADLTIMETAVLAEVPKSAVEKAVENKVFRPVSRAARIKGSGTKYVPLRAVAYFASLRSAELSYLPIKVKKIIWASLMRQQALVLAPVEFAPGASLDVERLAANYMETAERYKAARDAYIVTDRNILGGTPVLRGTRISVYSVLGRLQHGDTLDELVRDNPDIPREAFEAAEIFARAHPMRGRPGGRPWHNAA